MVSDCKVIKFYYIRYLIMSQKFSNLRQKGYTSRFAHAYHKIFFNFAPE